MGVSMASLVGSPRRGGYGGLGWDGVSFSKPQPSEPWLKVVGTHCNTLHVNERETGSEKIVPQALFKHP